ncbi:MAG: hypothetical protein KAQ87_03745 [Candidatus Pacebacteria bacterium]|nr:hypothetical protein [Candidatus Paceibacterota bacterium]
MNEIILVKSILIGSFFIFIAMVWFLAGRLRSKRTENCKESMINNIIHITKFKKDKYGNLKGVYNNREILIKIYPFDAYAMIESSFIINVETNFSDMSEQTLIPKSYFILNKKEPRFSLGGKLNTDSNNLFNIKNKINLSSENKIKQKSEILLRNKCFNTYTKLKVQAPSKKYIQNRGKVIFEKLNSEIIKDPDSLKIAMDIVVDIAKQMDETKIAKRN